MNGGPLRRVGQTARRDRLLDQVRGAIVLAVVEDPAPHGHPLRLRVYDPSASDGSARGRHCSSWLAG